MSTRMLSVNELGTIVAKMPLDPSMYISIFDTPEDIEREAWDDLSREYLKLVRHKASQMLFDTVIQYPEKTVFVFTIEHEVEKLPGMAKYEVSVVVKFYISELGEKK